MDEKELEEGMTWRELYRVSKEKVKVKIGEVTWRDLLLMIFDERSYFSLRKDSNGNLSVVKERSSKKVLDYFFEKTWQKLILKSRASIV
jgi:hypothetical protein